mgnify:CR=1 FL=1
MRILERLLEGPKKILWYLGEHPDLLQHYTDLQGLARRTVQLLRRKWEQLRQALRFMVRERRARRFPESDHKLAQAILFIWGNIPRFASRFRERLYRIRRFRIRTGNRWQVLFERIKLHPAWFLGSAVAVAAIAVTLSLYTIGVTVSYDGMNLGTVASGRVVRQAAADIEDVTCQTLGYDSYTVDTSLLTRKTRIVPRSTVQTKQEFEAKLSRQLGEVAYGYVLYVDDEPVAATEYEGAMEELLEQLKTGYITDQTVECYFVEDVDIRQEYVSADLMMNLGYIAEKLNATKEGAVTYTVQSGDTFFDIALEHEMSVERLLSLNPGYQSDLIHAGDTLTISNAVPYLTVVDVERQSYLQDVAYSVEYQDDPSIYEGDYEVLEPGVYGKEDVTANVTYINGEEQERTVISSVTLSDPVAETRARGTKVRPTWYPTGSFRWPCSGRITSRFGYRNTGIRGATRNHKGIDIACARGTPIYAADGGRVIFSGYKGAMGYVVIIDHNNGYVTYYEHNGSLLVSAGQTVYKGQQIAKAGRSGVASGVHCHFGIQRNGSYVNPLNYLS